jgi:hypothetical protein
MSPQRSTLSRIGSDYTAPVDIRAQRQYRSGMYRPEDNSYIQNYAKQDNLKHLFYTDCSDLISSSTPDYVTGMFVKPDNSTLFVSGGYPTPNAENSGDDNSIVSMPLDNGSIKSISTLTPFEIKKVVMHSVNYPNTQTDFDAFYPEPSGLSFKPDGTRVIICGNLIQQSYRFQSNIINSTNFYYYYGPVIFQYNLNTPWDLNSTNSNTNFTWSSNTYSLNSSTPSICGLAPDRQYALDGVSVKLSQNRVGSSSDQTLSNLKIRDIFVKPDGTRLYYLRGDVLYQSNISSSWDIGSNGGNLSAAESMNFADTTTIYTPDNYLVSISFSSDGSTLYLLGRKFGGVVYGYKLSIPWDITTATLNYNDPNNFYFYVGQYKTLGYFNNSQNAPAYYGTSMTFLNNDESLIVSNHLYPTRETIGYFQFDTLAF